MSWLITRGADDVEERKAATNDPRLSGRAKTDLGIGAQFSQSAHTFAALDRSDCQKHRRVWLDQSDPG